MDLHELSAGEIVAGIDGGRFTAEAVTRACLERIAAREPAVRAWAHVAGEAAIARAAELDKGGNKGVLHGVPVGIKDIIESYDQPTSHGNPAYAGHTPASDAATVALPRASGAIILGKTVTTEFANRHPGPTRNPHNPGHSPGGSSSGSAAAVGDSMVPLGTGTQTGGSVIRPAAYCGVAALKPTFGHFAPAGMKPNTEWLDTIGIMARSVNDLALFRAGMMHLPYETPKSPGSAPRIALCWTHHEAQLAADGRAAVERAAAIFEKAGARLSTISLPAMCADMTNAQKVLGGFEGIRNHADDLRRHEPMMSKRIRAEKLTTGKTVTYEQFAAARRLGESARAAVDAMFAEFDVILTAPAPGEAPAGLGDTGEAIFNYLWTYLWMPCVTMPFGKGKTGLPLGVQLVGQRHEDARLLDVASWGEALLKGDAA